MFRLRSLINERRHQVLVFMTARAETQDVLADVLPFSRGVRISRRYTRTGEYLRFSRSLVDATDWTLHGWNGDEHSEYEEWGTPG